MSCARAMLRAGKMSASSASVSLAAVSLWAGHLTCLPSIYLASVPGASAVAVATVC